MYAKLKELYLRTRTDLFSMATTYLVEKGTENVKQLSDETISRVQGNPLMTAEYCQTLIRVARDIANVIDTPTELIQFCDSVGLFETYFYTKGEVSDRQTLEKAVRRMATHLLYEDTPYSTDVCFETTEQLADYVDMETEELENLL